MRRADREVVDTEAIEAIIAAGTVCHLGFAVDSEPYVVPVSYGYRDGVVYVHCAKEGRKLDMLRANSRVCFEITAQEELIRRDVPCTWGYRYQSVIGYGRGRLLQSPEAKKAGLDAIMAHYGGAESFEYKPGSLQHIEIIAIEVTEMTGKVARQSPGS